MLPHKKSEKLSKGKNVPLTIIIIIIIIIINNIIMIIITIIINLLKFNVPVGWFVWLSHTNQKADQDGSYVKRIVLAQE